MIDFASETTGPEGSDDILQVPRDPEESKADESTTGDSASSDSSQQTDQFLEEHRLPRVTSKLII